MNPEIPVKAIQEQMQKKFHVVVSKTKAFRAKAKAQVYLKGDVKVQYSLLRDYVSELHKCNPDTTIKIDVYREEDPEKTTRMFRRIYVCLGALKMGFKEGGMELLGLDGAFMRGQYHGQMLTVVGVDANNGIYPVAYVIVESGNQYSWTWFLTCLADDLDLFSNSNFTFITDRQKGVLPDV
ncbi:receptor-like cytoplasmic kinase 176 [Tanacetum coccineum]